MCRLSWNLGASTFWNPKGKSRPAMGLLYLHYIYIYIYMKQQNFTTVLFESSAKICRHVRILELVLQIWRTLCVTMYTCVLPLISILLYITTTTTTPSPRRLTIPSSRTSSPENSIYYLHFQIPVAYHFTEYNQQDATFYNLFLSVRCSTCFRRVFRPSSGAQNCTYSARYLSDSYCYPLLALPG